MPSVLPFHIQGFSCQLAKDWYRGEELFILVLTSVNKFEDCDNHHVTGMLMGKRKNLRVPERI